MRCSNCQNPAKVIAIVIDQMTKLPDGEKMLCWHCYLGDRFSRQFPNGVRDETLKKEIV
jgi:hypothetical protein